MPSIKIDGKAGFNMYEGNPCDLKMETNCSSDGLFDEVIHKCQVYKYDAEEDYMFLALKEGELTDISLDAVYQCYISTRKELINCSGMVKERYQCKYGNFVVFKITDGFYQM